MRGVPDPKPPKRIVDATAGVEKLRREGECRLCGLLLRSGGPLSRHHLIPKGQQGDDVDENIVPLCGHGTYGCHGRVEHSARARGELRSRLRADEVAYCVAKVGAERFERRYPSDAAANVVGPLPDRRERPERLERGTAPFRAVEHRHEKEYR